MDDNKLETISNLFEDKEIRSILDSEDEEKSELLTQCRQLKMKAQEI